MQVEVRSGADDVSISIPFAAVFYIMMQPLQAEQVSASEQADSRATRDVICSVMPMMQVHCSANKILFVQKWSTCLVFVTNPEEVPEEECIAQMHVFAENTMAMLIEVCLLAPVSSRKASIMFGARGTGAVSLKNRLRKVCPVAGLQGFTSTLPRSCNNGWPMHAYMSLCNH